MRSVLLTVLAAAALIGIANWHYASASIVLAPAVVPTPTPKPRPSPEIAFRPGSGLPGAHSLKLKAETAADSGHIYARTTRFYDYEVISSAGTLALGPNGEVLRSTIAIGHDGPITLDDLQNESPGDLILFKLVDGTECWYLDKGSLFTPGPIPGGNMTIYTSDGTVTIITSKPPCTTQIIPAGH